MNKPIRILAPLVLALAAIAVIDTSTASADTAAHIAARRSGWYPWHASYYNATYGQPVALVVPPTAGNTTEFAWGVGGFRITPNYHQFGRPFPNDSYDGRRFRHTPAWPSDTTQFGVHYVRAPW